MEDFFELSLMDELDGLIRDHFGSDPKFAHTDEFLESAKTDVIPWFPQQDGESAFDGMDSNVRLQALTQAILGEAWTSDYCMVMFSKQGTSGQAWHQDCPPDNSDHYNLNRLVYTADIDATSGGQTVVVPGSHRLGVIPEGDPTGHFDNEVVLSPRKGMLVLIHGHTWHRVLPITGPFRYSTNYRACPRTTPKDITDVCVYRNMRYQFSTAEIIERRQ